MKKHLFPFVWSFVFLFLGSISSAQNSKVDSLKNLLETAKQDTNKVNLFRGITGSLATINPEEAIPYGENGIELARKLKWDKGLAQTFLNLSVAYSNSGKFDTTLILLDSALVYAKKVGDPKRIGLIYLNKADNQRRINNYSQALKDADFAFQFAEKAKNNDVKARVYQTIGAIYYAQEQFNSSIEYYEKAEKLYLMDDNQRMIAIVLNNKALAEKRLKKYDLAISNTKKSIQILEKLEDWLNLSYFTANLSDIYILKNDYLSAEKQALISLNYANQINSDHAKALAQNYLGLIYSKQNKLEKAIGNLTSALPVFRENEDWEKVQGSADILAEAYEKSGNPVKANEFLRMSLVAKDSLNQMLYQEEISTMQTQFRVKEKDNEIQLLTTEKELQEQKLSRQRILTFSTLGFVVLLLAGIALLINRNKLRRRIEEMKLRNEIAADLHDEVGSSISSIQMLSQMGSVQNTVNHSELLGKIEQNSKETMEKMSDILWMIKPGKTEAYNLKQRMEEFAFTVCQAKTIDLKMDLAIPEDLKLSLSQRKSIYLLFKEAVNNAAKYSETQVLEINSKKENGKFYLEIKDFGKGFDLDEIKKGNGLDNMKKRAEDAGGKVDLYSEIGKGTTVLMTLVV